MEAISPQLLTLLSSLVVSPSLSRRTFKVPGRGLAPQGRLLQDRSGKVQMVVTEDGDMIARSGKALKFTAKKKHNLAKSVKEKLPPKNTTSNKLHIKNGCQKDQM